MKQRKKKNGIVANVDMCIRVPRHLKIARLANIPKHILNEKLKITSNKKVTLEGHFFLLSVSVVIRLIDRGVTFLFFRRLALLTIAQFCCDPRKEVCLELSIHENLQALYRLEEREDCLEKNR